MAKYKLLIDAFGGKAGEVINLSEKQVGEVGTAHVIPVPDETPTGNKALTNDNVIAKTLAETEEEIKSDVVGGDKVVDKTKKK